MRDYSDELMTKYGEVYPPAEYTESEQHDEKEVAQLSLNDLLFDPFCRGGACGI